MCASISTVLARETHDAIKTRAPFIKSLAEFNAIIITDVNTAVHKNEISSR